MQNMPDTETTSPETRQGVAFVLAAILFMLVVAAYWPVREHEFFLRSNDECVAGITNQVIVPTLKGIQMAYNTGSFCNIPPLARISHMVDGVLFAGHAGSHHLMNVFLHGLTAGLLLIVLTALTRTVWASLAAAVLFALHPAHVETVAWVSQRKTILGALLLLLALWAWNSYGRKRAVWSYVAALGCFALALLAKPSLIAFPLLLLVLDAWPLRRAATARSWAILVVEKIPFLAMSVASVILDGRSTHAFPVALQSFWNIGVVFQYIEMLIWPFDKSSMLFATSDELPFAYMAVMVIGCMTITILALLNARRYPALLAGWCWYWGMLLSMVFLWPANQIGCNYFASIGLWLVVGWLVAGLHLHTRLRPSWVGAVFVVVAAGLLAMTMYRAHTWPKAVGELHHHEYRMAATEHSRQRFG